MTSKFLFQKSFLQIVVVSPGMTATDAAFHDTLHTPCS